MATERVGLTHAHEAPPMTKRQWLWVAAILVIMGMALAGYLYGLSWSRDWQEYADQQRTQGKAEGLAEGWNGCLVATGAKEVVVTGAGERSYNGVYKLVGKDGSGNPYFSNGHRYLVMSSNYPAWCLYGEDRHEHPAWGSGNYRLYTSLETVLPGTTWERVGGCPEDDPAPKVTMTDSKPSG